MSAQDQIASDSPNAPTLRTTTRLVYVDVVVRDAGGHIVHGLQESDFHLSEDKQAQQVRFFSEHTSATSSPHLHTADQSGFSNVPASETDRSLNIVLLDLADTDRNDQTFAYRRMVDFLRRLPPGRQVGLFVLSDRLHMVQNLTSDSAVLAKAAEGIDLAQTNRTRAISRMLSDESYAAYLDSQATIPQLGDLLRQEVRREDVQNVKARLDLTAEAFRELAAAVNGYPGRKNLFWIAGQFPSQEYFSLDALSITQRALAAGNRPNPNAGQGVIGETTRLALDERADQAVADSQIAVYPISVLGVETDSIDASLPAVGLAAQDRSFDNASVQMQQRQINRSVMNHIADETGGEAFYGNNDVNVMLRRGFEDSDNFYTLAYSPTDHNWNGKYRTIQVGLLNRSATLSYRRGYVALPEQPAGNALHQFQTAMQISSPPATMLRLRAIPSAHLGTLTLDSTLDLGGIGFTEAEQNKRTAQLVVGLVAYPYPPSADAKATQTEGKLRLTLSPEQYRTLLSEGVKLPQQLPLASGKYLLRLGVLDQGSGRIGTLTIPVAMP